MPEDIFAAKILQQQLEHGWFCGSGSEGFYLWNSDEPEACFIFENIEDIKSGAQELRALIIN